MHNTYLDIIVIIIFTLVQEISYAFMKDLIARPYH